DTVTDNPGVNGFVVAPSRPTGVSPAVLSTAATGPAFALSGLRVDLGASSGKNLQDWLAQWDTVLQSNSTKGAAAVTAALEQALKPFIAIKLLSHGPTEQADLSDFATGLIKL